MSTTRCATSNSAPPVIIVGAGPSGLAASACLALRGVESVVLERDDCVGSLWRKRAYDRLHLHLPKHHSALPHAPHADDAPAYLPRDHFVRYLDAYADRFDVRARLRLRREVRSARFVDDGRWEVEAVDLGTGEAELYAARFLVVATGKFDEKVVPAVPGLDTFPGETIHASEYRSAEGMQGKEVLVVGCGNSGMEIALDLAEGGAGSCSVVVRGEVHLMTREIMSASIPLLRFLPLWMVDRLTLLACRLVFGDTAKHGLPRPAVGPLAWMQQGKGYPVIDVGTYDKIKKGRIQVLPAMTGIDRDVVEFAGGGRHRFDAIIFATGYRCTAKKWLKEEGDELIGKDGKVTGKSPKGAKGLYRAGMAARGLTGSGTDAEFIADDISRLLQSSGVPGHEESGNVD
uniref:Uncharacterized protein n=1 Tax=Avena sativa TaxID=4498 RepID=A0ACD6A926_AVESA